MSRKTNLRRLSVLVTAQTLHNLERLAATDHFAVVKCSKCGHEAFAIALYVKDGNFCPACGAPMTDEAVEMVMERLEGFHGQENP